MQKASLPDALRSWGEPTASSDKGKKPVPYRARRTTLTPVTESDKILAVAPIYVGPERRPQGRPKPIDLEDDDEDDDVVVVDGPQRHDNPGKDRSPPGKDFSGPSPLLDFLAFLKVISPEIERNKALGNVLGLVHGPDGTAAPHPPPDLANAMTLFSDLQRTSHSHRSQPESAPSSHNQHRRKSSSTDDEIVFVRHQRALDDNDYFVVGPSFPGSLPESTRVHHACAFRSASQPQAHIERVHGGAGVGSGQAEGAKASAILSAA